MAKKPNFLTVATAPAQAPEPTPGAEPPVTVRFLRRHPEFPKFFRGDVATFPLTDRIKALFVPWALFEWERPNGTPENPDDHGERLYKGDVPTVEELTPDEIADMQSRDLRAEQLEAEREQEQAKVLLLFLRSYRLRTGKALKGWNRGEVAAFDKPEAERILQVRLDHMVDGVLLKKCPVARPATQADLETPESKRIQQINADQVLEAMREKGRQ